MHPLVSTKHLTPSPEHGRGWGSAEGTSPQGSVLRNPALDRSPGEVYFLYTSPWAGCRILTTEELVSPSRCSAGPAQGHGPHILTGRGLAEPTLLGRALLWGWGMGVIRWLGGRVSLGPHGGLLQADGLRVMTLRTSESSGPHSPAQIFVAEGPSKPKARTRAESPGVRGPDRNNPPSDSDGTSYPGDPARTPTVLETSAKISVSHPTLPRK